MNLGPRTQTLPMEKGRPIGYPRAVPNHTALQLAVEIARLADDCKSQEVFVLDLRGLSAVTDFVVICTGTSDRQMRGLTDSVVEYARKVGERPFGVAGLENAAWILVDFVDVVLHVFSRPARGYYDLELLWGDAPRVPWARAETA